MLENLLALVKQHAGEAVINNPAIPNEQNDAVIKETTQSITGGLQNMLASGGISDVLKMFGGAGRKFGDTKYFRWCYSESHE